MDFKPEIAARAIGLVAPHLPRLVKDTDGSFEDWRTAGPIFVARATHSLRSIFALSPPLAIPAAEDLTRSLVDQVITFSWIAANPDERTRAWVADLYRERLKLHNKIIGLSCRPAYEEVMTSNFPEGGVLAGENLERACAHRESKIIFPNLLDRATQADDHWRSRIPALEANPFALIYCVVYSQYSFTSHPSVQGGLSFTRGTPEGVEVGNLVLHEDEKGPWGIALVLYLLMLIVAAHVLGWPRKVDAYAVMTAA